MSRLGKFWKGLLAGGAAGVAAMAAVNAAVAREAPVPETGALGGEAGIYPWEHGQVFYRHAGDEGAVPVLFLHGIGAGARSFMWRRNFEPLSHDFRVYALDLLGFGYSDKPATAPYSADLYLRLISDFLRDVVGRPAALVAHSLSAAYAVGIAGQYPERVASLVLVTPTGVSNLSSRPGMKGAAFYGLLHSPVLGYSFYNAMTSERSVRDYAREQLFYEKRFATPRLIAHYYAVSHLPGAQYAMTAFVSGFLNFDIRGPFSQLEQPVTLVWGRQDTVNPFEQAGHLLRLNPRARLELFDRCRQMPQEEHAARFNDLLRETLRA
jgi:pimeloyl-ACP methyl ester carboxylesterase